MHKHCLFVMRQRQGQGQQIPVVTSQDRIETVVLSSSDDHPVPSTSTSHDIGTGNEYWATL